jgi:uncharacterized protein with HEPN domain
MSDRGDQDYLNDILEAMERIAEYISGLTSESFMLDRKTQDAVIRNLEIIGEGAKALSMELTGRHPEIPWSGLAGVRDKMIHYYFGLNYDVVWTIASEELPSLLHAIHHVLSSEETGA